MQSLERSPILCMLRTMGRWCLILIAILVRIGLPAQAQTSLLPYESSALVHWPIGSTAFRCDLGADEWRAVVSRSISSRVGVFAYVGRLVPWDLALQLNLVMEQPMVHLAVQASTRGMDLLATLDFGPVLVEGGRHWFGETERWARLEFSPHPQLTMVLGVTARSDRLVPFAGFEYFAPRTRTWGLSLFTGEANLWLAFEAVL